MKALLYNTVVPILAAGDGSGFEGPTLEHEFNPPAILFAGTPFEMNRILLVRMVAVFVLAILLIAYARSAKLVPNRFQGFMESLIDFSKVQIGEEILGKEVAYRYQPLLLTLFLGTLFMNLTGVIPGLQIAGTSLIGMPLVFGLAAYFGFIIAGLKVSGAKFFKLQLMPPGVPKPLYLLMVPLEFLSTFILRPITLAVRLLVNMVSGHFLLVLCFLGTHFLYFELAGGMGAALGSLTLLAGIIFVAFELFVGALQAYIFTMLTAAYISLSISEH